jgi:DNA-binding transcriptional regulator YiaG
VTQQPEPSRIVEETAIRILDELAVEGGRATRAHLFDAAQVKLWGHVVNVAARRAGYSGHNEAEIERHGKEQLFQDAMVLLFEREQVVKWDQEGNLLALSPPPYRDGYVPGSNLWRSQRQLVLTEMRGQLMQFWERHVVGDQSFEATMRKAGALYEEQLRRGQLKGAAREEALVELLKLADVLFDLARLASLFGIDESEIRAAATRRLQPTPLTTPPKRKHVKRTPQSDENSVESPSGTAEPQGNSTESVAPPSELASKSAESASSSAESELMTSDWVRRERTARRMTQKELGYALGFTHSVVGKWETGANAINIDTERLLRDYFAKHPVNGQT